MPLTQNNINQSNHTSINQSGKRKLKKKQENNYEHNSCLKEGLRGECGLTENWPSGSNWKRWDTESEVSIHHTGGGGGGGGGSSLDFFRCIFNIS